MLRTEELQRLHAAGFPLSPALTAPVRASRLDAGYPQWFIHVGCCPHAQARTTLTADLPDAEVRLCELAPATPEREIVDIALMVADFAGAVLPSLLARLDAVRARPVTADPGAARAAYRDAESLVVSATFDLRLLADQFAELGVDDVPWEYLRTLEGGIRDALRTYVTQWTSPPPAGERRYVLMAPPYLGTPWTPAYLAAEPVDQHTWASADHSYDILVSADVREEPWYEQASNSRFVLDLGAVGDPLPPSLWSALRGSLDGGTFDDAPALLEAMITAAT